MFEINNPIQLSFDSEIDIKTKEVKYIFNNKMSKCW